MLRYMPNRENAYVEDSKLYGYLLSETHPIGSFKAAFFSSLGYRIKNAKLLESHLVEIAATGQSHEVIESPCGTKFVIDGTIVAPAGGPVVFRTAWIIDSAGQAKARDRLSGSKNDQGAMK